MKLKYPVIFDWDGTLANSIPNAFSATCQVFETFGVRAPDFLTYVAELGPPFTDFYYRHGVQRHVTEEQIWETYHRFVDHGDVQLFPEALIALTGLRMSGHKLCLVTSQSKDKVDRVWAESHRNVYFDGYQHFDAMPSKVDYFQSVVQRLEVDPQEVIAIGDFASDARQAQKAGVKPVGIVHYTDCHDRPAVEKILRGAGAVHVLHSLGELQNYVEL